MIPQKGERVCPIHFPLDSILEVSVSVSGFFSWDMSEGRGVNYLATLPRQQNTLIAFNWPIVSSLICSLGSDLSMLAATLTPQMYTLQRARNYWPTAEKMLSIYVNYMYTLN